MKTRIITAAVALPIIIASIVLPIWVPQAVWLFVAIAAFAMAAGLFEFYSLTKKLELKADPSIGYLWAICLFIGFVFDAPAKQPDLILATIAIFLMAYTALIAYGIYKLDWKAFLTWVAIVAVVALYDQLVVPRTQRGKFYREQVMRKRTTAARL